MSNESKSLIKRIARLVKEKNELLEHYEQLSKEFKTVSEQNERFRELISRISPDNLEKILLNNKSRHLKLQMVTVLYAGITGWEKLQAGPGNSQVMDELDAINQQFDKISKKYNIRRIKTIGDTFMCAGGVPEKNMTNPVDVVMAAIEMQNYIECHQAKGDQDIPWGLKIGIHTGPVTADVTKKSKTTYDLKGNTINIASRLESMAQKGDIFISIATSELVKEFFTSEYSHKIPVKYSGDLEVFKIKGLLPQLSADETGKVANRAFHTRYGLLQFTDIQEIVLDKLEKDLPVYLYYHNVKHTVDVVTQAELIGLAEGVSDEELLLLKMAALFHDAGHTIQYDRHEEKGCEMAHSLLRNHGYKPEQLDVICQLIMATQLPPKPNNLLEKIMCDADLDYLGRIDMIPVSNTLYKELKEQNKIENLNEWNKLQIRFISGHQYFTKTARNLREVNKQKQIERIKSLIS
jgi:adenylate cyclase